MPLYEYRCTACGHRFEKIQSFSAPDEKACPKCGAPVERLISAPAIHFKGSGFYLTDYAKSGSKGKGGESSDTGGSKSESAAPAAKGDGAAPSAAASSPASAGAGSASAGTSGSGGSSPAMSSQGAASQGAAKN